MSPDSASTKPTSTSATSVGDAVGSSGLSAFPRDSSVTSVPDCFEAPPLSAFKKKRRLRRSQRRQPLSNARKPAYTHYWNEYDDGDEGSENEPFAIYIDPNKSNSIPGMSAITHTAQSIASRVKISTKHMRLWMRSSNSTYKDLDFAHVDENTIEQNLLDDESEFGDSPIDPLLNRSQHHYATFHEQKLHHAFGARESLLFRSCITSFLASFALLIVAALLATSARRRAYVKVNIGVITGVVFSLVFGIVGVMCMFKRTDRLSPWHRLAVFMALAMVCVLSGMLLGGVVDG